jgi:ParB/RepB/Spo0J family partition protein
VPKPEIIPIEKIYVPVKRRKVLRPEIVREIAESILQLGQQTPISVRQDNDRFILVDGLHRLEACKALGEESIRCVVVSAELSLHRQTREPSPEQRKIEHLKRLRLQKEAEEKASRPTSEIVQSAAARSPRLPKTRMGPLKRSTRNLADWLEDKERSGSRY